MRHSNMALMGAAVLAVAGALAWPAYSAADEDDDLDTATTRCFSAHATIHATIDPTGCTSPVGLCTSGVVRSEGRGFLRGTTHFTATGLGGAPVGEASIVFPPAEPATTWSYSGDLELTTPFGNLSIADVGVLDTAHGTFTELERIAGGTGRLDHATGNLFIYGNTTPDGMGFDGTIRGRVCLPRR